MSRRKLGLGAQRRNSSWRHQPSKAAVIGSVGGGGGRTSSQGKKLGRGRKLWVVPAFVTVTGHGGRFLVDGKPRPYH